MRERQERPPATWWLIALSAIVPAIAIVQGVLVSLAHNLEPSAWAMWIYWCALFTSVAMGVPPAIAGYVAVRRSSRLRTGKRAGLLVGVLGSGISALLVTLLRIVRPESWQHFIYINGPPPDPLVSPLLVFVLYFGVSLFYAWLGARIGAYIARAQDRRRHRDEANPPV